MFFWFRSRYCTPYHLLFPPSLSMSTKNKAIAERLLTPLETSCSRSTPNVWPSQTATQSRMLKVPILGMWGGRWPPVSTTQRSLAQWTTKKYAHWSVKSKCTVGARKQRYLSSGYGLPSFTSPTPCFPSSTSTMSKNIECHENECQGICRRLLHRP